MFYLLTTSISDLENKNISWWCSLRTWCLRICISQWLTDGLPGRKIHAVHHVIGLSLFRLKHWDGTLTQSINRFNSRICFALRYIAHSNSEPLVAKVKPNVVHRKIKPLRLHRSRSALRLIVERVGITERSQSSAIAHEVLQRVCATASSVLGVYFTGNIQYINSGKRWPWILVLLCFHT